MIGKRRRRRRRRKRRKRRRSRKKKKTEKKKKKRDRETEERTRKKERKNAGTEHKEQTSKQWYNATKRRKIEAKGNVTKEGEKKEKWKEWKWKKMEEGTLWGRARQNHFHTSYPLSLRSPIPHPTQKSGSYGRETHENFLKGRRRWRIYDCPIIKKWEKS